MGKKNKLSYFPFRMKKALAFFGILLLLSIVFVLVSTEISLNGNMEGLYLLKGANWRLFELKDDILMGEYERVLFHVSARDSIAPETGKMFSRPSLKYKWHEKTGEGYIISFSPNGTRFLVSFGRFIDSTGAVPRGLFVGGGLPLSAYKNETVALNETGVAFFDSENWRHLWCNANEVLVSPSQQYLNPTDWEFLKSKVMYDHEGQLVLRSIHRAVLDGVPLKIDRFAYFRAGDVFFTLMIRIRNVGEKSTTYRYVYGDEPWVGNFGTSRGNVGWTKNKLYFYEGRIDTGKYSYAGMVDHGNKALPDERSGPFSETANFIQWMGEVRPETVYFSNRIGSFAEEEKKVPLSSPDNRVLFLEWGPRPLQPDQAEIIILTIGMAVTDPATGMPVKPELKYIRENLDFIISNP